MSLKHINIFPDFIFWVYNVTHVSDIHLSCTKVLQRCDDRATALYCTVLYYIVLYCTALYYTALTVLYCVLYQARKVLILDYHMSKTLIIAFHNCWGFKKENKVHNIYNWNFIVEGYIFFAPQQPSLWSIQTVSIRHSEGHLSAPPGNPKGQLLLRWFPTSLVFNTSHWPKIQVLKTKSAFYWLLQFLKRREL